MIQDDIEADADMNLLAVDVSSGFGFFAAKGMQWRQTSVLLRFTDSDCKDHGYSDRRFKQTIFCSDTCGNVLESVRQVLRII